MGLVAGCLCRIPITSPHGLQTLSLQTLPLQALLLLLRRCHRPARLVGHCR